MAAGTNVTPPDDGTPPPGLAKIVANNGRRLALIEWKLGMVTDDTLDDLTEQEAAQISGMTTEERVKERAREANEAEKLGG